MPHKDINNLHETGMIYFLIVGLVGGFVQFFKRKLTDKRFYQKCFIFIYDSITAGSIAIFIGLITYYI